MTHSDRSALAILVTLQCLVVMGWAATQLDHLLAPLIIAIDTIVSFWLVGKLASHKE